MTGENEADEPSPPGALSALLLVTGAISCSTGGELKRSAAEYGVRAELVARWTNHGTTLLDSEVGNLIEDLKTLWKSFPLRSFHPYLHWSWIDPQSGA